MTEAATYWHPTIHMPSLFTMVFGSTSLFSFFLTISQLILSWFYIFLLCLLNLMAQVRDPME